MIRVQNDQIQMSQHRITIAALAKEKTLVKLIRDNLLVETAVSESMRQAMESYMLF